MPIYSILYISSINNIDNEQMQEQSVAADDREEAELNLKAGLKIIGIEVEEVISVILHPEYNEDG